jgi:hypothetical protein
MSSSQVPSSKIKAHVLSGLLRLCTVFLLGGCGGALQPRAPDPSPRCTEAADKLTSPAPAATRLAKVLRANR